MTTLYEEKGFEAVDDGSLYKSVFENSDVPSAIFAQDGLLLQVNPAFSKLLGISSHYLVNLRYITDFVVKGDKHRLISDFTAFADADHEGPISCKTQLLDVDRNLKVVEFKVSKLPGKAELMATVDHSNWLRLQEEVAGKTEDLDNLFHLISHNLKTPIVSIKGFANLLLEHGSLRDKDLRHYTERILENASLMNVMIQDILEFSSLSRTLLTVETIDLNDLLNEVRAECFLRLKKSKVEIEIAPGMPKINASSRGISAVFTQLIDNSIKYSGDEQFPRIRIGWQDKGRFYVFSVQDNGRGVSPENQETVFDLFNRADMNGEISGTGVGLSVVKRIVEKHNGLVRLTSKVGEGTTVYFTVPKNGELQSTT